MSLGKLKEKLVQLKDQIDEAEERAQTAKQALKEAEALAERNEGEADGIRRRCQLLSNELDKVMQRVEGCEARLDCVTHKNETDGKARQELEDNEMEGDEQTAELEDGLKEALEVYEETQHRVTEAQRRRIVLIRDNEITSSRYTVAEKKINELTSILESTSEKAKDLERSEDESFEREQVNEEKINFFEAQLKEEEQRAEDALGREKTTKRVIDSIEDEITVWKDKSLEVEKEMANITSIADDL